MATPKKYLKPDSKGRITLGSIAKNISSYEVHFNNDGSILLEPQVEIPAKEAWLFQNKEALNAVKEGLQNAASGKVKKRGSFTEYTEDKDEIEE